MKKSYLLLLVLTCLTALHVGAQQRAAMLRFTVFDGDNAIFRDLKKDDLGRKPVAGLRFCDLGENLAGWQGDDRKIVRRLAC